MRPCRTHRFHSRTAPVSGRYHGHAAGNGSHTVGTLDAFAHNQFLCFVSRARCARLTTSSRGGRGVGRLFEIVQAVDAAGRSKDWEALASFHAEDVTAWT